MRWATNARETRNSDRDQVKIQNIRVPTLNRLQQSVRWRPVEIDPGDCRFGYTCQYPPKAEATICAPSCGGDVDCNDTGQTGNVCRSCDGLCLDAQRKNLTSLFRKAKGLPHQGSGVI